MSDELNIHLKKAYYRYESCDNPPVPLKKIKEFLKNEGVSLEREVKIDTQTTERNNKESDGDDVNGY